MSNNRAAAAAASQPSPSMQQAKQVSESKQSFFPGFVVV